MPSPYFSHSVTPKNKTLLWNRILSQNLAVNGQWYNSEVFPFAQCTASMQTGPWERS